uniref:Uncharacterized protein n=1 Tax=Pavo cristatus TaxID=9049 RepID=A0A8C9FWQ9_PAVCR
MQHPQSQHSGAAVPIPAHPLRALLTSPHARSSLHIQANFCPYFIAVSSSSALPSHHNMKASPRQPESRLGVHPSALSWPAAHSHYPAILLRAAPRALQLSSCLCPEATWDEVGLCHKEHLPAAAAICQMEPGGFLLAFITQRSRTSHHPGSHRPTSSCSYQASTRSSSASLQALPGHGYIPQGWH